MDPELKQQLEVINNNLVTLNKKVSASVWRSFFTGGLSGVGSIIGAAVALVIIGWVLNVVGVIPALKHQAQIWQQLLEQINKPR